MLTRKTMKGYYVLVPTPSTKDGEFDEKTFRSNISTLADQGVDGVVTTGTLGEFHTIRWKDHQKLMRAAVDEARHGLKIVVGCSAINTEEAIMKTKFAQDSGVDAAMNAVPFYQNVTRAEAIKFWKDVASACTEIGLVIYNNPVTTKTLLDASVLTELAKIPNMCGSKEIVGYTPLAGFDHWMSIVNANDLSYFCCDPILPAAFLYGARGVTSENYCLRPKLFTEVYKACLDKDWTRAKKLHYEQLEFTNFVYSAFGLGTYTWFCVLKAALDNIGIIKGGYPRDPFIPVPENVQKKAREAVMKKYGSKLGI